MMIIRGRILFLITILALAGESISQTVGKADSLVKAGDPRPDSPPPAESIAPVSLDTLRKLTNNAFEVGERLRFDVKYGFINAGDAAMTIGDTLMPSGRKCYRVDFAVDSKPVFDWVYKVVDRYSTFID